MGGGEWDTGTKRYFPFPGVVSGVFSLFVFLVTVDPSLVLFSL